MFTGSATFSNCNETTTINKKQTDRNIERKLTDFSQNLETLISPNQQYNQIMRNPLSQQDQTQKFPKKQSDFTFDEKINKYPKQVKSQTARSGREFQIKVTKNEDEIQFQRNKAAIYSIKNMKHRSDLPIYKQFLQFQENQKLNLSKYYQDKKIETITEDEIEKGVKSLEILFDSQKLTEIQNKVFERNNEKEITKIQNIMQKKVTEQELKEKAISPVMFAQILPGMDNPQNFTNSDKNEINEQIQKLEQKEIGVIESLYLTHFKDAKDQKIQNTKDANYLQIQNEDQYNFFTQQSEQILKLYSGSDKQTKNTNQQIEMTQVKYIQYLPKKLGYSKYNFDKAIKSLYTISPTNISEDPEKRKKNNNNFKTSQLDQSQKLFANSLSPKSDNNGFLYGHHQNSCYGRHNHSRECSKVKDVDLAQLQSLAFQFILLQKPLLALGVTKENLPPKFQQLIKEQDFQQQTQASFFPEAKIPLKLQENLEENEKIKKFLNIPINRIDHLINQSKELASKIQEIDLQEILNLRNHLIDFISKQNSYQNQLTNDFNAEQSNQYKKYPTLEEQLKKVLSEGMRRSLLEEKDTNAKEEQLKTLLGSIQTREQTLNKVKLKNYRRKVRNHIEKYQDSAQNNEIQYLLNDPFLKNAPLIQILSEYFLQNSQNLLKIQTGQENLLSHDTRRSFQSSKTAKSIAGSNDDDQLENFRKLILGSNSSKQEITTKFIQKTSHEKQINKSLIKTTQNNSFQKNQQNGDDLLELTKQTAIITTQKSQDESQNIDELLSNGSGQDCNNTQISATSPAKITKSKYFKPSLNFKKIQEQQNQVSKNLIIKQLNQENIQSQKLSYKTQTELDISLKLIEHIKKELSELEEKLLQCYEELIDVTNQIEQRKEKGLKNKKEWKSPFQHRINKQYFYQQKLKAQAAINFDKVVPMRVNFQNYSQWNEQELHKRKKEIIQDIFIVQQKAKLLVQNQNLKEIKQEIKVQGSDFYQKNQLNVQIPMLQDRENLIDTEKSDTGTGTLRKDFKFQTAEKIQLMKQIQQRPLSNNTSSVEAKDFDEEVTSNYALGLVTIDRPKSAKGQKYSEDSVNSQKDNNFSNLIIKQNQTLTRINTNEYSNEGKSPEHSHQDNKLFSQNSYERQRIKVELSKDQEKDRDDIESFIEEQQAINVQVSTPSRNVQSPVSQKILSNSKLQAQFMKVKEQRFTKAQLAFKWNKNKMSATSSGYGPSGFYPGYAQPLVKDRQPYLHNQDIIHSFVDQGDLLSSGEKSKNEKNKQNSQGQKILGTSQNTLSNSIKKKSRNFDSSSKRDTFYQNEIDEQINQKKTPNKISYSPVKRQVVDFMNFSNIHLPKQKLDNCSKIQDDALISFDQKDNYDILSSSSKKRVLSVTIKTNQAKQMPTNVLPIGKERESSIHSAHQGLVDYKLDVDLPNLYEEALAKQKAKMENKHTKNQIILKEEIKIQKVVISPKTLQIGQSFKKDGGNAVGVITKLNHKLSKN